MHGRNGASQESEAHTRSVVSFRRGLEATAQKPRRRDTTEQRSASSEQQRSGFRSSPPVSPEYQIFVLPKGAANLERLYERIGLVIPDVNVARIEVGKDPRLRRVKFDIPARAWRQYPADETRRGCSRESRGSHESNSRGCMMPDALHTIGALDKLALDVQAERHGSSLCHALLPLSC